MFLGKKHASSELAGKKCVPCRGDILPFTPDQARSYLRQLEGWTLNSAGHLEKSYAFPDFAKALAFVDRLGATAEEEGHHPDIHLAWGRVRVEIWTHKIKGLAESDFILAAKSDALYG